MKIYSAITVRKIITVLLVILFTLPNSIQAQDFYDATDDVAGGLPVTLVSFSAAKINSNVRLNWVTSAEYNNSHFNVQRSLNGRDFNTIGIVTGRGISNLTSNYLFTDSLVPNANLYYRLQQVDKDGTSTFSSIVLIKFSKQSTIELTVYPNPVVNHTVAIGLKNCPVGIYTLSFKNLVGQNVFTGTLNQMGSISNTQIKFPPKFLPGVYILCVTDTEGKINLTQKIIID